MGGTSPATPLSIVAVDIRTTVYPPLLPSHGVYADAAAMPWAPMKMSLLLLPWPRRWAAGRRRRTAQTRVSVTLFTPSHMRLLCFSCLHGGDTTTMVTTWMLPLGRRPAPPWAMCQRRLNAPPRPVASPIRPVTAL